MCGKRYRTLVLSISKYNFNAKIILSWRFLQELFNRNYQTAARLNNEGNFLTFADKTSQCCSTCWKPISEIYCFRQIDRSCDSNFLHIYRNGVCCNNVFIGRRSLETTPRITEASSGIEYQLLWIFYLIYRAARRTLARKGERKRKREQSMMSRTCGW